MKTIIISDIHGKSESIIPYGLNLAKTLESEVDILHPIDSRIIQGEYSSFSDSKSITPGHKFSQKEIVQREKSWAQIELDKLLSSEASRLNYPLKINTIVEENSIIEAIETKCQNDPSSLFVISSEANDYTFQSIDEILTAVKNTGIAALLVPPEKKFKEFEKILMPVNFESEKFVAFNHIKFLFEKFKVMVDAVSVAAKDNYLEAEAKAGTWKEIAKDYFLEQTMLKTNVLEGDDFMQAVIKYTEKNMHDLILLLQKKENSVKNILRKNELDEMLKMTKIPVFIQFYK
ncbi:MAG TPA: hypothetical protein VKA38_11085 [Draconibacterium sp.]|nr:hypothetical protein [Draconibacterium sp.]